MKNNFYQLLSYTNSQTEIDIINFYHSHSHKKIKIQILSIFAGGSILKEVRLCCYIVSHYIDSSYLQVYFPL